MEEFDLIIVGAGPGGYTAAIRASQLGQKVAIIDKRKELGGTCMNVGCIPSKALLESSELYHRATGEFHEHGISTGEVSVDFSALMKRKQKVVEETNNGIAYLMKKNKIQVYHGMGSFLSAKDEDIRIQVKGESEQTIKGKKCIVATGSAPVEIPAAPFDGKKIISSDEAVSLEEVPRSMTILGGGVIGLELGSVYRRLGCEVTIVEMLPDILPAIDKQLREAAKRSFKKQGLDLKTGHRLVSASVTDDAVRITMEKDEGEQIDHSSEVLLVAVGRKPLTEGLGLENTEIQTDERGRIKVDPETLMTDVKGVYAIGDVIDGPMLAHRAEEEGVFVAETLGGQKGHVNYETVPFVVYTSPEIAWVGKSEETLKEEGQEVKTGKFLFRANGRARAANQTDGMVKLIADAKTDRLLGGFIVGAHASELLGEIIVCMEFGGSAEDLARSFHSHPTLSESIKEAALDVASRSINS